MKDSKETRLNDVLAQELRQYVEHLETALKDQVPDRQARRCQIFGLLGRRLMQASQSEMDLPESMRLLSANDSAQLELFRDTIGAVLEGLIREQEGKESGTYYTSKEVVQLMCRLALGKYLTQQAPGPLGKSKQALLELLREIKIVDPAMGCGAFLYGMLEELTALRVSLGEESPIAVIQQEIIANNLYGVDQEGAAVEVVRLGLGLIVASSKVQVQQGEALLLDWHERFPAVMATGGFDIILANPPYVSQDRLTPKYKAHLRNTYGAQGLAGDFRSDLYVYFFGLAKQILNQTGVAVMITSTAWLDVEYGASLRKYLLEQFALPLVLDSACERWFRGAAVNTAIVVLSHQAGLEDDQQTVFISLQQGLHQLLTECSSSGVAELQSLATRLQGQQINTVKRSLLLSENSAGKRCGGAWGKYLRAPEAYFRVLELAQDKLCRLDELAHIKRGITSGCNEFFYLKAEHASAVEADYLYPVIKSPKETLGYQVDPAQLSHRVVLFNQPEQALAPGAVAYIKQGEAAGYHNRTSLAVRQPWWRLHKTSYPVLIFRRFFYEKFNLPYLPVPIAEDQTFYGIYYQGDPLVLAAIMNSTLTWLFIELHGRTALGEGVLQYAVYEAAALPIINPGYLQAGTRDQIKNIFRAMSARPVADLAQELASPDRRALDSILLAELVGESSYPKVGVTDLQEAIYHDFYQLVQDRLAKSQNNL